MERRRTAADAEQPLPSDHHAALTRPSPRRPRGAAISSPGRGFCLGLLVATLVLGVLANHHQWHTAAVVRSPAASSRYEYGGLACSAEHADGPWPRYVMLGAMKAGTSTLFDTLWHQQGVCAGSVLPNEGGYRIKEKHFWDRCDPSQYCNASSGCSAARYLSRFGPKSRGGEACMQGGPSSPGGYLDASPSYFVHPRAPGAMAQTLTPKVAATMRLFAQLREPLSRLVSQFGFELRRCSGPCGSARMHYLKTGDDKGDRCAKLYLGPCGDAVDPSRSPIDQWAAGVADIHRDVVQAAGGAQASLAEVQALCYLTPDCKMLGIGMYAPQLERWAQHFPRHQLFVQSMPGLLGDVPGQMKALVDFLGLPKQKPIEKLAKSKSTSSVRGGNMTCASRDALLEIYRPYDDALFRFLAAPGAPSVEPAFVDWATSPPAKCSDGPYTQPPAPSASKLKHGGKVPARFQRHIKEQKKNKMKKG